jgi:hypothetical protein
MASIFDQIKADREVGTKGDFGKVTDHEWSLDTGGENAYYVIGPNNRPLSVVAVEQAFGLDHVNDADMRRFCRLPQLERIALAAEGFAALAEVMMKDLVEHGGYTFEDDFKDELAALNAFREASA